MKTFLTNLLAILLISAGFADDGAASPGYVANDSYSYTAATRNIKIFSEATPQDLEREVGNWFKSNPNLLNLNFQPPVVFNGRLVLVIQYEVAEP